jgi:uncharacterized membrane protein
MVWLLLLHIVAVLCWCASLLYLPALIVSSASQQSTSVQQRLMDVVVMIYKLFTTPAALIAIISGTTLFLLEEIADSWLILKLTLVFFLVLCHAFSGWIILHNQQASYKKVILSCLFLGIGIVTLILAIIWVVLTKPF